ncbi:DUF6886 family protein [Actinoplanes sp. NPDC049548]|uniref:DUF6886 family protein n=1 Tax=Actinoplanes sp. NPDC049548 TaxID=3155152 RepID=UPI00343CB0D7
MRPSAGQVMHFSEDPHITRFAPHVAATAQQPEPYVWAVDAEQAPAYWFPRDCPRVMFWPAPGRVHAIEYGWLRRLQAVSLYAYRFDAALFRPFGSPRPHAMVATETVTPLGPPEPVGDLIALHEQAGIELRLLTNLWSLVDEVVESSWEFSCIRLRNADARA